MLFGNEPDLRDVKESEEKILKWLNKVLRVYLRPYWGTDIDRFATSQVFREYGVPWGPVDPSPILNQLNKLFSLLLKNGTLDADSVYELQQRNFARGASYLPSLVSILSTIGSKKTKNVIECNSVLKALDSASVLEISNELSFSRMVDILVKLTILDKKEAVHLLNAS